MSQCPPSLPIIATGDPSMNALLNQFAQNIQQIWRVLNSPTNLQTALTGNPGGGASGDAFNALSNVTNGTSNLTISGRTFTLGIGTVSLGPEVALVTIQGDSVWIVGSTSGGVYTIAHAGPSTHNTTYDTMFLSGNSNETLLQNTLYFDKNGHKTSTNAGNSSVANYTLIRAQTSANLQVLMGQNGVVFWRDAGGC